MKNSCDLWIFGDSFTSTFSDKYWTLLLKKKFNGKNFYLNSCDSRDIQTIMDCFYKNLHNISKDSLVCIFLPSLARIRYPKSPKLFDTICESNINTTSSNTKSYNFKELFIHWPYADYPSGKATKELDFPFNEFDFNKLNFNQKINYNYKKERDKLSEAIEELSPMDFAKLLNANESTSQNWNDIFYSIQKAFPFKVLFFSWTDEFDSNIVWTKEVITEKIGFWHTMAEEFEETNGVSGYQYDEHFSHKMHKSFYNLITSEFPQYF